jgi:AraC family transcriptional regulator
MDQGALLWRAATEQLPMMALPPEGAGGATERDAAGRISFLPAPQARRRRHVCPGVTAETVSIIGRELFESRYCGPLHLLIAHERLTRRKGITTVEGLPDSNLENLSQTFTFVPAGRRFREWHDPDFPSRVIYIHIDPAAAPMTAEEHVGARALPPRLHFHNPVLWQTVLKLMALVEHGEGGCSVYGAALGVVLAHELVHLSPEAGQDAIVPRGGLAVWQRRLVAQYLEEHLAEQIPVARLAEFARLSRYHFCRAFRRSFGISPHRYHANRRLERAKSLLATPALSVTEIALDVGFRETSSFTTAFRKLFGRTPTDYRRSLSPNQG